MFTCLFNIVRKAGLLGKSSTDHSLRAEYIEESESGKTLSREVACNVDKSSNSDPRMCVRSVKRFDEF